MTTKTLVAAIATVALTLGGSALMADTATTATASAPLDWRHRIEPAAFAPAPTAGEAGALVSPRVEPPVLFDEVIYDWKARLPRDEGLRLYLQVEFGPDDVSPWLYAGYWGDVPTSSPREKPAFEHGLLDYDHLLLKRPARALRFKVTSEGRVPLTVVPSVGIVTTLNKPTPEQVTAFQAAVPAPPPPPQSVVLDLPLCAQVDTGGYRLPDRCQSAAVATAMAYYGTSVPLEQIIALNTDFEYNIFGIWPRTIGVAHEFGFDAYIDRFRDWDAVRRTVAENKVILPSIRLPRNSGAEAPPYAEMSGHIIALNGLTPDGRVVVTDSALAKDGTGYRCQWLARDLEIAWMGTKGGVGMVICPPPGASMRTVSDLPPFPLEARRAALQTTATAQSKETSATAGQ